MYAYMCSICMQVSIPRMRGWVYTLYMHAPIHAFTHIHKPSYMYYPHAKFHRSAYIFSSALASVAYCITDIVALKSFHEPARIYVRVFRAFWNHS